MTEDDGDVLTGLTSNFPNYLYFIFKEQIANVSKLSKKKKKSGGRTGIRQNIIRIFSLKKIIIILIKGWF